ncbi:HNH endonuclease [Haloarcula sp. S1AR25-5A]|uniref:HNH endonuclease n=1 Tax=Haloarcula terrestris TaxID=2950533 RepID=A0AAE4JHS6_9EURY|nr:HNH endonuclease [Haloarcula terrestris]MDS0222847.1 HNH endonuclease [Haloarcula terrestris]
MDEKETHCCYFCDVSFEDPSKLKQHHKSHDSKIPKTEIQDEILRLASNFGRAPTCDEMKREGIFSVSIAKLRFGSWSSALRSVGLEPAVEFGVTPDDIREDIQDVAETLGQPPTASDMRELGTYSVKLAQKRFDSWNNALSAAGFSPNQRHAIPERELLDELTRLKEELGQVPTADDMDERGQFSRRAYFRCWDGWQDVVRAAGYEPKGYPTGSDNHRWKEGSVCDETEYGPEWGEQRKVALERDEHTCQMPGCSISSDEHLEKYSHNIHVHHVQPLSSYRNENGDIGSVVSLAATATTALSW